MRNAITRLALAAVTAASLGFGATQALAAPAAENAAHACKPDQCDRYCREKLGGIRGECINGQCLCLF